MCSLCGNTTNTNLTRLAKLQKRAARMSLKADFMTPPEQLLKELNWLPFLKRVQYHTCLEVYKNITGQASEGLVLAAWHISPQCSRMSRNNMIGKPGQQLSIYCTFPDHIQPTLTGHFQFKVQNYGIVYQRILETAYQSIDLKANWSAICSRISRMR